MKENLAKAHLDWMGDNVHAITFVFNKNIVSASSGGEALREFHRRVDKERLGGRYYRYPENQRLRLRVVPEKWDIHPHYHGLIDLPSDDLAREGLEALELRYNRIWQSVVPGGSIKISPISDPMGWFAYASKETDLSDNVLALDSLVLGAKTPWTVQPTA